MRKVHDHGPTCAGMGDRLDGILQAGLFHGSASPVISVAELLITAVTLVKADIPFCLAQIMVGYGRRIHDNHLVLNIFHHYAPTGSIGDGIVVRRTDVRMQ